MPSTRRNCITQAIAILAAVAPAGGYVNDLTASGTVSIAQETVQRRRESGAPIAVRVRDMEEEIERASVTGDLMQSRLRLAVELMRKSPADVAIVDAMNDLIADVRLAIDRNTNLNGVAVDAWVAAIEPPAYDFDQQDGTCTMYVDVLYYLTQGAGV